jgi:hypothetical protein
MIDYDKLKLAHTLTKKLPYNSYSFDCWCTQDGYYYVLNFEEDKVITHEHESKDIDDLINILQAFAKSKSKYKTGDTVWYIDCTLADGPICTATIGSTNYITGLFSDEKWYAELSSGLNVPMDCCYPTREDLIKAQIMYWSSLKSTCEHVFMGVCYSKCFKCGEFYR